MSQLPLRALQKTIYGDTLHKLTLNQTTKRQQKTPSPKLFTSKDKASLRASYIVSTLACLYTLQQFLINAVPGSKAGYCNGAHNTSFDSNILMILGVCDIAYQWSQNKTTASLHPLLYIHAPGEKQIAFMTGLYELRKLSLAFFGLDLVFDFT
jgi:hypothetical protein